MDLNAEVDQLIKTSQAWIPMIMEYGSRVLLALVTLAIGWWLINRLTVKLGQLLALRRPTWHRNVLSAAWSISFSRYCWLSVSRQ